MSSIVYLKNKRNGKVYAYLNESVWDSEKKKCVCKRKCLGHLDPDTGDIIPNRGHESKDDADVKSIGVSYFLEHIAESIGLKRALREAFPDAWKLMLSCVFYILIENSDLARVSYWSEDNHTPYGRTITHKALTDAISDIDENCLFRFYREWRDTFKDKGMYMIHLSSISTYDTRSDVIRFNDLPSTGLDTRTHLSMTFGSNSRLPMAYQIYSRSPKSLTDLRRSVNDIRWLDVEDVVHILDMPFCTEGNFDDLLKSNQHFLMRASPDFPFARDSINRVKDRIMDMKNYMTVEGESFFVMSFINYWKGRKCFAHIIFSTTDAEREFSLFLSLLDQCYNELLTRTYVPEHDEFYQKYFIVEESVYGRKVEQNGEAIMTYNDIAGFVVLISNTIRDPTVAFRHYMQKDSVQRYFENLRNRHDRLDLSLYRDQNYSGRVFLQFLSTIMYSEIKRKLSAETLLKNITYQGMIHEMKAIKKVSIPGFKTPFYTNLNNIQLRVLKAFDMDVSDFRK